MRHAIRVLENARESVKAQLAKSTNYNLYEPDARPHLERYARELDAAIDVLEREREAGR